MVGLGTMQPVAETFRLARRLAPGLARRSAWRGTRRRRTRKLVPKSRGLSARSSGIELLEANVDGSPAVREAVASLIGRGAEAIWIGGDNVVLSSLDAVIGPARASRRARSLRVFQDAQHGALFDLGADYHRVGESIGRLAGRVLGGESPADMPILYEVPPEFWINRVASDTLTGGWSFPAEVDAQADVVVEKKGPARADPRAEVAGRPPRAATPSRNWTVGLAAYSESALLEEVVDGVRRGIKEAGLVEGRDFKFNYRNAQGDIATLNAVFDELSGTDTDLIVSISNARVANRVAKVRADAGCLRRGPRSDCSRGGKIGLRPSGKRDRRLSDLPLRADGPERAGSPAESPPCRHPFHARRGQLGAGARSVRGSAQDRGV